jgi:transcriptional regulator with XRE-family HTH domain
MEPLRRIVQTSAEFGALLRAERRARGLTQARAAALAGVGARLWNEAECGKRQQLGLETALRMLQTLGLDLSVESRALRGNGSR